MKKNKVTLQLIEEFYRQGLEDDSDDEHLGDEGFDDLFFNEDFSEDEFDDELLPKDKVEE